MQRADRWYPSVPDCAVSAGGASPARSGAALAFQLRGAWDEPDLEGAFRTTRWSLVLSLRSPDARAGALEELCQQYWFPLYLFARRRGLAPDEAADATQALFAQLLEREDLERVDPAKGSLRSYLKGAMAHALNDARRREERLKRGGGARIVSIDAEDGERRLASEPASDASPERAFERSWATQLVRRALERLRAEAVQAGDEQVFEVLAPALVGESERGAHARHAEQLGRTEGAVRVALHRLRRRCRELIEHEVRQTLAEGGSLEEELARLFEALDSSADAERRLSR